MNKNLYFIMGTADNTEQSIEDVLEEALSAGITEFQLREKGPGALTGDSLLELAKRCKELCARYKVPFFINDNVDLCIASNADGLHIGQEDASVREARAKIGPHRQLGVSVHTVEQAIQAMQDGADYLGIGPVYSTSSKADARPPSGVSVIKEVHALYPNIPIVGIGGITENNAPAVWEAGASGIAVISAIARSTNRRETIQLFKQGGAVWS
ncbi:thiamine phosphate synthase [Chryseomicrobium sp. FSL W7-1435]|uniref:thiamine phosphate synthase n=1 Tax=Chryseomicrobium sp. FSL W7-1435 TaxID=2921704 RepID=UPI003159D94E